MQIIIGIAAPPTVLVPPCHWWRLIFTVLKRFSAAPISKWRGRARFPSFMVGASTSRPCAQTLFEVRMHEHV